MSELRQFAERYHQVKKQMENLEEVRLAQISQKYGELVNEAEELKAKRQQAEEERNACQTGTDWLMWQQYVLALQRVQEARQQEVVAMSLERESQQKSLWSAHTESVRWETLADRLDRQYKSERQRLEGKNADELAALRQGSGGGR